MFLNILESWDSFKKNGCLGSEPTLKMNLTSWTFTSLLNLFTGPSHYWDFFKNEWFVKILVVLEHQFLGKYIGQGAGQDIPIFPKFNIQNGRPDQAWQAAKQEETKQVNYNSKVGWKPRKLKNNFLWL